MTKPARRAARPARSTKGACLPRWDLSDLYRGRDDPALGAELDRARRLAEDFAARYRGRLAGLDGAALGAAIAEYETISEILQKAASYAQLVYAGDIADPENGRFHQGVQEKVTEISTLVLFFTLEINRIDDETLAAQLAAPAAARYAPWLRDLRVFRPHQLSDEVEQLLHEKQVTGASAWGRLFEETVAALRFPVRGKKLTSSEALNLLSDCDPRVRRTAAKALGKVFGDNVQLFALITNVLAKDKEIEDIWRHYPHPAAARNLANHVEEEVVTALVTAVKESYPRLSHRYYALKARWLGKRRLDYWDRNAPLPEDRDRRFSWDEARDRVLGAYAAFSPDLAAVGRRFFDGAWIDADPRPGKSPGAFAHPTVPSAHPYLLLNYHGRARDVMTLAHELGHGCHQVLAAPQGVLMADTPLTLAETASVFGEMLTFRAMLDAERNPRRRRLLLAAKVEDMLNTVVRQIAFHDFEWRLHNRRRDGELAIDEICALWLDVQRESLGPAFRFDDEYRYYWTYIPHFIHSPFYVYAYAFGDCLVNSLYDVFRRGHPRFQEKYLDLLRAGGTLRHKELLAPFGLDAGDPGFWLRGLDVVAGFVDELEAEG